MAITKWDRRFLVLAQHISHWSKDPSTQVGAVIVRPNRSVASVGFNGFPIGVEDSPERLDDRELKYQIICHGESNALDFAVESVVGYTLYTYPFLPCPQCAGRVIQRGISRVVAPMLPWELRARWEEAIAISLQMFKEAGVVAEEY